MQSALLLEGEDLDQALHAALAPLPAREAAALLGRLCRSGLYEGLDMERVLDHYSQLIHDILAVARGNLDFRPGLEEVLPILEGNGWLITDAVHRLWDGERSAASLVAGLDSNSALLVRAIVEQLVD